MKITDLHWLAGIWEGEGCFGMHRGQGRSSPAAYATLRMTDLDIVERVGRLLNKPTVQITVPVGHKTQYAVSVWSRKAVGLMMTLYTLLGERRRERIRRVLQEWKSLPTRSEAAFRRGGA